jgi:cell division protein FtsQ
MTGQGQGAGNRRVRKPVLPEAVTECEAAPELGLGSGAGSGLVAGSGSGTSTGAQKVSRMLAGMRAVVGVGLVAACSIGVAWAARRHVTSSPRFAVAHVEVAGNERRAADAIVAESGIAPGANVFVVDLDAARARLLADPWIADATLARRLPATVLVQVTERKAAALLVMGGDTLLATADGQPFKRLEAGDPVDLPVVTGLAGDAFASDAEGARRTVRRAIDVAAEYERGSLAKRSPLEEVHVDGNGAYSLVVGRSGMQLVLGAPPFRRKLDQATRVVAELDKRGGRAEAILLDNEARPERVVVRMR